MNINDMWQYIDSAQTSKGQFSAQDVLLAILLAFVLGQTFAWVYYFTHAGLSYSRAFVQSLVLVTVVVALVMTVIGNNVTRAFGLMGAMSIIRFRNVVKDTRDMVFIFAGLAVGMAAGTQAYSIAVLGTIMVSSIFIYLHLSRFGTHKPHNGFLRFTLPIHIGPEHPVISLLKRFCSSYTLISVQDSGAGSGEVEYAYQLMIRNADRNEQMISEIEKIEGMSNVSLTMQEVLLEV